MLGLLHLVLTPGAIVGKWNRAMGHDIYACLERTFPGTGYWEPLAENVTIRRHSTLFAVLADVFDTHGHGVTQVSPPRGQGFTPPCSSAQVDWQQAHGRP